MRRARPALYRFPAHEIKALAPGSCSLPSLRQVQGVTERGPMLIEGIPKGQWGRNTGGTCNQETGSRKSIVLSATVKIGNVAHPIADWL